jgi:hypothetical protein
MLSVVAWRATSQSTRNQEFCSLTRFASRSGSDHPRSVQLVMLQAECWNVRRFAAFTSGRSWIPNGRRSSGHLLNRHLVNLALNSAGYRDSPDSSAAPNNDSGEAEHLETTRLNNRETLGERRFSPTGHSAERPSFPAIQFCGWAAQLIRLSKTIPSR